MKPSPWMGVALMCAWASTVEARPGDTGQMARPTQYEPAAGPSGLAVSGLSSASAFNDTVCYGGTLVDGQPDPIPGAVPSSRPWKAGRSGGAGGGVWTFDTGLGSNFSEPTPTPKPAGYHHRLEGWMGRDNTWDPFPWFRRSTLCVLNGGYSMYAGLSLAEAQALCYTSGQGYGNGWNITLAKTFTYPGSGNVTLSYRYQTDCEPGYDYLNVNIDTTGIGAQEDVSITSYTANNPPATATHALTRGITLRSTAGPITIKFNVTADGAYSDEDGFYVTECGHSTVDDIGLSGAIADLSDFESGTNGWSLATPVSGPGGEWADLRVLSSLPPPLTFCLCTLADSVMVFADATGAHNTMVDNTAGSPWIDLLAGGDVGRPGKLIQFSGYFELPLTNYLFVQTLASWYPAVCPATGLIYVHPPRSDGYVRYFSGVPNCSAVSLDFSAVIPPTAEQVKVWLGVLSYCWYYANCGGVTNSTPWFDDVSLCVFGAAGTPIVTQRTIDTLQDNFASDGTINPSSPGRVDVNIIKSFTVPGPGTALGDTLVVNGDGGNTEVRVVFRVRPGPYTNASALTAWAAAKWTAEPGLGAGWYSARMDSAEQKGVKSAGRWMGTLHELDPKFGGGTDTDRGGEGDVNGLTHDIFPDRILTPASRIDYFVTARYLPPDPRNPGGTAWYVTPDTTGGRTLEMEILPSSMAHDTTWNCILYVDHHSDRDPLGQQLEEQGLVAALGAGGATPEGTGYDRYDVNAPSSQVASFGRPLNTQYGASVIQTFAYKAIVWHSSSLAAFNLVDEDANNLAAWLGITEVGRNRFWGSGDGLVRSMATEAEPTTVNFLNNVCGVRFSCDTIRLASCPAGSVLDSTYCLPLVAVAGADFASALPLNLRGNGCPEIRSFDLLSRNTSVPTTKGQLAYQKLDGAWPFASITNYNTVDVDYKTVLDGFGVGQLRDPDGSLHNVALCDIQTPAVARSENVFSWFQDPVAFDLCWIPCACAGVGDPPRPGPPPYRTGLGPIYPNPMNPTTRIHFVNGREGERVRLAIFDVTGRLVRTLLDAKQPAGPRDIVWDGRDDEGQTLGSGMYFVRLVTRDAVESKKVVVAK